MQKVPVYDWVLENGRPFGCGTALEFNYWSSEGVIPQGSRLAKVITHEPASEDERRKAAWGLA